MGVTSLNPIPFSSWHMAMSLEMDGEKIGPGRILYMTMGITEGVGWRLEAAAAAVVVLVELAEMLTFPGARHGPGTALGLDQFLVSG